MELFLTMLFNGAGIIVYLIFPKGSKARTGERERAGLLKR